MELKVLSKNHDEARGLVVWFHGLGANAYDFFEVPLMFSKDHRLRYLFPNAPVGAVTLNGGYPMPSWYDILSPNFDERSVDMKGLEKMTETVHDLMKKERLRGVPYEMMTLIGFSQGGSLALHAGLSFPEKIRSIVGLSTYLANPNLKAYAHESNFKTPILLLHGSVDPVVSVKLADFNKKTLREAGYQVDLEKEVAVHTVTETQIERIDKHLSRLYP